MTASMLLEVLLAADGSAIDRAGKMDCTRGGNGDPSSEHGNGRRFREGMFRQPGLL